MTSFNVMCTLQDSLRDMVKEVEVLFTSSEVDMNGCLSKRITGMIHSNCQFEKELSARISYLNSLRTMPNKDPAKSSGNSSHCASNSTTRTSTSSRNAHIGTAENQEFIRNSKLRQEAELIGGEMRTQPEDSNARVEQLEPAEAKGIKHRQKECSRKGCPLCNLPHQMFACDKFKSLSHQDRFTLCKRKNLCFNCLKQSHKCRYCRWKGRCTLNGCRRKHSTLLHIEHSSSVKRDSLVKDNNNIHPETERQQKHSSGKEQMPVETKKGNLGAMLRKCGKRVGQTVRTMMSEVAQFDATSVFHG